MDVETRYDFDRVIDRRNTYSMKHDAAARGVPEDVLPLWVADMDFCAPPCVVDALEARSRHGIFGYSVPGADYFESLQRWFSRRFDWNIESDWLVKTPGVVTGIHIALCALTAPGDGVLIQPPVYHPFSAAVQKTGRELLTNELVFEHGTYHIDFEDFERKIADSRTKLFILCNPHNPVGRVWTRAELTRMGDLCLQHGVLVVADEIHQDFVYPGHTHHVFVNLNPAYRENTVTCTAPSKTFNIAGLQISNLFIPNPHLRALFREEYERFGLSQLAVMGLIACRAAYDGGEAWLEQLRTYLAGNLAMVRDFLSERIPQIKLVEPEGTYLAWLDCRALGLDPAALNDFIVNRAKLWLDGGTKFGAAGAGFQRMNIACPRATLQEALVRLECAVKERSIGRTV